MANDKAAHIDPGPLQAANSVLTLNATAIRVGSDDFCKKAVEPLHNRNTTN